MIFTVTWFRPPSAGKAAARPRPFGLGIAVALLTAMTSIASAQPQDVPQGQLRYTIDLSRHAEHIAHVAMTFPCNGTCDVQLPVWNALYQVRDFAQYVRDISVKSADKPIPIHAIDKTTWRLNSATGEALVEYNYLAELPAPFGADVSEHHAFLNLALLLMCPLGKRDLPIQLELAGVPKSWQVATAADKANVYIFDAPHLWPTVYASQNYDRLVDSPIEIGDFKEASFQDGSATYRVVVDADPADYDMSTLVEHDRKIVQAETEWMQDVPFHSYLFIYHFPRGPAGEGMEHAYSTAISASADRIKNNPQASADVSAHEFFHLWNVKRIRPQSLEPVDYSKEQYSTALWFSEGVTSTVGELMMVRAGLKTEDQFLTGVADEIETLQSRSAHLTQSAEESSLETWFDKYPIYHLPERSISYYNKGFILGVLLDLAMRDATHGQKSLRELFLYLNQNYAKQGRFFADSAGIREAAEAVSGTSFQQFFGKSIVVARL